MGTNHSGVRPEASNRLSGFAYWAALTLLVSLCACTEKSPVRLGFVGGLSGRVADLGISGRDGALLAVEQRNAQGGIRGRPVQLLVRDDRQDPEAGRAAVQELIDAEVAAIIGPMTSSMAVNAVPLANRHRVVMVSPTVTTTDLSGIDDFFLRVSATTREYARKTARHLALRENVGSATLVYDLKNEAYTRSWTNHFRDEFQRLGARVAAEVTFTSGADAVMHEVAGRALAAGGDAVVISASAMDAAMLCQQFAKLPSRPLIAVSEWAATESFLGLGGAAVEGVLVDQFFDRYSTDPTYLRFVAAYRSRFATEPGFGSVNAYDAANLIMDALEQPGDRTRVKSMVLALGVFEGVQGKITLDAYGESDRQTHLSVVSDGKFAPVE